MNKLIGTLLLLMPTFWLQAQAPQNDALLFQAGHVRLDLAGDGCDESDLPAPLRLNFSDGVAQQFSFGDQNNANYALPAGSYQVTPQLEFPEYFQISPETANIVLTGSNSPNADFCLTANGIHRDAEILILPHGEPIPGKPSSYDILVRNKGNQTLSGFVNLDFPGHQTSFIAADPSLQSRSANAVRWRFDNFRPFEQRVFRLTLQNHQSLAVGESMSFLANVAMAESDETPDDNETDLKLNVSSSLDPNNKIVLEGPVVPPSMIGQYLNYIINFQNTGTTTIQKVVINDQIDTNQFEFASVQVISLSHPGTAFPLANKVEAYFQDINLAPGQSGYVAFKIKTKATLPVNSTVSNKAKIYFDFNFPIETNSVHTTFQLLGTPENRIAEARVYPNPAGSLVTIEATHEMGSVSIADAQGRVVAEFPASGTLISYDTSSLASGLYCVRISTSAGGVTQKLVKQ